MDEKKNDDVVVAVETKDGMIGDIPDATQHWQCCCMTMNKGGAVFLGQLLISILIIALCSSVLFVYGISDKTIAFSSLLFVIVGAWLQKISSFQIKPSS